MNSKDVSNEKYRKANTKRIVVRFFPGDSDIFEWMESRDETRMGYIKRLIREDMERNRDAKGASK